VGLIIAVYSLALVFLENTFDFKNLFRAKAALSAFIVLTPISLAQSLFLLSIAPKYRNSLKTMNPVSVLSSSAWTTTSNMERKLRTFENKIWRVICGPVYDNEKGIWKRKYNKELQEEMEMASVVSFIRGQRIQWLGHMWWRSEDDLNRVVLECKSTGKRPRGRPRKRWLDVVEEDLNRMGVQDWRELVQDRDKWRDLVMAVKTLKEY